MKITQPFLVCFLFPPAFYFCALKVWNRGQIGAATWTTQKMEDVAQAKCPLSHQPTHGAYGNFFM